MDASTGPWNLSTAIAAERRALYARARGGVALPASGAIYWGALAAIGFLFPGLPVQYWLLIAFAGSGLIFPAALGLQYVFDSPILEQSPLSGLAGAALAGMLLSWAITLPLFWAAPEIAPLALAIGMSLHWPAIGWMYGRTRLFTAHAAVRAVLCAGLWFLFPAAATAAIPAAVCVLYVVTSVAILLDADRERRRLCMA